MIQSRDMIPKYLTDRSKDIHTFLRLIDLVSNNSKLKSDDFINILNPDKCPNVLLPLLASYLGYKYDYNETSDRNRVILRSYKNMIKNKGNTVGIQLAISASISMLANKSIIDAQSLYDVAYYDKYYTCTNCNYIAYSEFDICPKCGASHTVKKSDVGSIVSIIEYPIYSAKSYDLIEAVRPAGTNLLLYSGTIENQVENLGISDFVKIQTKYLNLGTSEIGGDDSFSGSTTILTEYPVNMYYCEDCGKLFKGNSTDSCPFCGSNNIKLENNSSLRYLYRLHNTNSYYDNTVGNLIESISNGEIKNDNDCVGIILRIHIDHTDSEKKWDLSNFIQSFIFGIKPYIFVNYNDGDYAECFDYTVADILNRIVEVNNTAISTLQNRMKPGYTYKFLKDSESGLFVIRVTDTNEEILDDGTVVISTFDYNLNVDNIELTHLNNRGNLVTEQMIEDEIYDFRMTSSITYSKSKGFGEWRTLAEIDENGDITTFDEGDLIYSITSHETNGDDCLDKSINYIKVCGSCGADLFSVTDACPNCGNIKTYSSVSEKGVETTTQSLDPSILYGSYIIDLYFN